jgi:serine/threonine protein kinase
MPLTAGARLGSYEVIESLGAGGMGEVYRARDTKLRREVAIKVLPEEFAADPDRIARFQREAELLATLNHPNIAAVYGVEESTPSAGSGSAVHAIVMELVEGETLEQRLRHGAWLRADGKGSMVDVASAIQPSCALSVNEALSIARQLVDALEAAQSAASSTAI